MDRAAARRRRGRPPVSGLVLVLLTGLTVAVGASLYAAGWEPGDILRPRAFVEVEGRPVAIPRPAASDGRLRPAIAVTSAGAHAFLHTDDESNPVGYDPCRPVEYVVRPDGAPREGATLIEEAVAVLEDATGLLLLDVGTTDEPPAMERALIQPDRYGRRWAPVLIAWSDPQELPELAGQVAGVGGSAAVPGADGTGLWLAAGRVALDAPDFADLLGRPGGYQQARAIVVHELAHVLGLDHVDEPTELMHPVTSSRTDLGPGDRQGLALLGQVACER